MDSLVQKPEMVEVIDSVKRYAYWKYGYYDSIPKMPVVASDSSPAFSDMIGKYQSKDFEYVESISDKLNFLDKLLNNIKRFLSDLFPHPDRDFNEGLFNILAVIGGLVVVFLIYKFFVSRKQIYIKHGIEQGDEEQQVDFVERNLMHIDVKTYLDEALEQKNYTLAIRYLQLMNIQLLGRKGMVQWDQSKTNMELIEQVDNSELKKDFLACASLFDYTWFGNFDITSTAYDKYAARFIQFQKRWS